MSALDSSDTPASHHPVSDARTTVGHMGASIDGDNVASLRAETTSSLAAAARAIGIIDGLLLSTAVLSRTNAPGVADEIARIHTHFRSLVTGSVPARSLRNGPQHRERHDGFRKGSPLGHRTMAETGTFLVTERDLPSTSVDPATLRRIASQWRAMARPLHDAASALRYDDARPAGASWTGARQPAAAPHQRTAQGLDDASALCTAASRVLDDWAADGEKAMGEREFLEGSIRLFRGEVGTASAPWWLDGDTIYLNAQLALRCAALRGTLRDSDEKCRSALARLAGASHEAAPSRERKASSPSEDTLFGPGGRAHGMDVTGGALGDCWFLSSLAALAESHAQTIHDRVHENPDGTYTVTLWMADRWVGIVVDAPMRDEPSTGASLWPLLITRAAIIAVGGADHLERLHPTVALAMLTGRPAASCSLRADSALGIGSNVTAQRMPSMEWLASQVATGEIAMVACSRQASPSGFASNDRVDHEHSFWVKDMTDAGGGTGSITVVDLSAHAPLTLTWDEYRSAFDGATYVLTS